MRRIRQLARGMAIGCARLVRAGFRYYPAGSVHPDAADFFIRPELVAEGLTAPSDQRPLSRPA